MTENLPENIDPDEADLETTEPTADPYEGDGAPQEDYS